jgi:hypothetical protein
VILDVDLPTAHEDGQFISGKVSRIVELIREYDSSLDVKWIPPERRQRGDAAFAITERAHDTEHVVFYVQTEAEFDEDVLARIIESDNKHHDVHTMIESKNKAAKMAQAAKAAEEQAAHIDFMASMIGSKKNYYRHGGKKYSL